MNRALAVILVCVAALTAAGCGSSRPATTGGAGTRRTVEPGQARSAVLTEARRWIGTPYRPGGSDRDGMDCSGFVSTVFMSIGHALPRTARDMYGEGQAVSRAAMQPADLVFFKNTAGRGITHVGIYLGSLQFIHSSTSKGVIISRLDDEYYRRHYAGARRVLR